MGFLETMQKAKAHDQAQTVQQEGRVQQAYQKGAVDYDTVMKQQAYERALAERGLAMQQAQYKQMMQARGGIDPRAVDARPMQAQQELAQGLASQYGGSEYE